MKKYFLLFPYAFAFYYLLNFFSVNPVVLTMDAFLKAFFFFMATALVIHIVYWLLLKDRTKASVGALFFLVLFFSYILLEQVFLSLIGAAIPGNIGQILFAFIIVVFLGYVLYWLKHTTSELKAITSFLSIFIIILIIMPSYHLVQYAWAVKHTISVPPIEIALNEVDVEQLPDIYHIVLDGYGRADVLKDYYGLDNSDFITYLEKKGFTVRDDCHTNYIWTQCSVASMLSMDYLGESDIPVNVSGQLLSNINGKTGAGKILADYGYKYFEIASPVPTQKKADFMGIYKNKINIHKTLLLETPFKYLFVDFFTNDALVYDAWRNQLLNYFNQMEAIIDNNPDPSYVFCHLMLPHPPFVFDIQGNGINPPRPFSTNDFSKFIRAGGTQEEYKEEYIKQLLFTNYRLQQTIDTILSKNNNALIIISSDHGPRLLLDQTSINESQFHEALPIFLAYKIPEQDIINLEKVISPVNLYRVIINYYCMTEYKMLPDNCYYSPWANQLKFIDINCKVSLDKSNSE